MVEALNLLEQPVEEADVDSILIRARYIRDLAALPAESRKMQVKQWFENFGLC